MPQATVEISTSSQSMDWPNLPQPQFPKITLNGEPLPQPKDAPDVPSGFQVVVFDSAKDPTDPASILSNEYLFLYAPNGLWGDTYQYLYAGVVRQVLCSGNIEQQTVLVASYGLDANMPPTSDALGLFLTLGSGPQLQQWETTVDVGSEGSYVGDPANYILIGGSDLGYGEGTEVYGNTGSSPVQSEATATIGNP
jgi:hypothetical protein